MPLLLPLLLAQAEPVPAMFARLPTCPASGPLEEPCVVPRRMNATEALNRLGDRVFAWSIDGDTLTVVAKPTKQRWVMLCCSVQSPMEPVTGTDLAAITVRVPRLDEAILDIRPSPSDELGDTLRGPNAPAAPPTADPLVGATTEVDFQSDALGTARKVWVYVPPGLAPGERVPVLYLADALSQGWAPIAEAMVRDGTARAAILVGIADGGLLRADCAALSCNLRQQEYVAAFGPSGPQIDTPFGRHMRFVTEELIPHVEAHFPVSTEREDRIVGGTSNGADWALSAAKARPDLFGSVIALSAGATVPTDDADRLADTRIYGGAGTFESSFLKITLAAVEAARSAGARVRTRTLIAGHSPLAWDVLFAEAYEWLLPPLTR